MGSKDLDTLLQEMSDILDKFRRCRSLTPHIPEGLVGVRYASTAPYYRQFGYDVQFDFGRDLTKDEINNINSVGHYINQNFVVRLFALLNSYQIVSRETEIDNSIPGSEEVDILRRLRHKFAHSSGKLNQDDQEEKKLHDRIIAHFNLVNISPDDFNIPIDDVLDKIYKACEKYVNEFMKKHARA